MYLGFFNGFQATATRFLAFAQAAEARILQIEALDRRGRVALHMAETAAEKEVALGLGHMVSL